jgi:hypothetical protein
MVERLKAIRIENLDVENNVNVLGNSQPHKRHFVPEQLKAG